MSLNFNFSLLSPPEIFPKTSVLGHAKCLAAKNRKNDFLTYLTLSVGKQKNAEFENFPTV